MLALLFVVLIILIGSLGFYIIEGYQLIDALYMTIITIATVGFKEIEPLSTTGKFFTIFLIITSFGTFAYGIGIFSRYLFDGIISNRFKLKRVKNKIAKLQNHVIVVGYGRNGSQATKELTEHGEIPVIIDLMDAAIEKINTDGFMFIQGDASDDHVLNEANIKNAKALITALPKDADNLFVVLTAKELNPSLKIISRASNFASEKKLKSAGASNVIMPDKIGGQHMANLVAQPDIIEFLDHILLKHSGNVLLEEISCSKLNNCFVKKTIGELDVRNKTGANIIGIRNPDGSYIVNPSPSQGLFPEIQLFVLGTKYQLLQFKEILTKG